MCFGEMHSVALDWIDTRKSPTIFKDPLSVRKSPGGFGEIPTTQQIDEHFGKLKN